MLIIPEPMGRHAEVAEAKGSASEVLRRSQALQQLRSVALPERMGRRF